MKHAATTSLLALTMFALGGCRADQEAIEQGVDFDAPAEVENAPLVDTVGPERLGDGMNTATPDTGAMADTAAAQAPSSRTATDSLQ